MTAGGPPPAPPGADPKGRGGAALLALAYVAFVSLGLPDAVLGVAWPSLRRGFGLSQAAMGAALSANVAGYFASGLLAGALVGRLGVGALLALSTALVAAGQTGFAAAPAWSWFVASALVAGLGSGAVDAALNGHAAAHFTPRHMNWLHACYGVGASLGPSVMTAALSRAGYRAGYAALAAALGALALGFAATRARWGAGDRGAASRTGSAAAALRLPRVWLQVALFFAYTGLEASAGQWAFTVLRERGLSVALAGGFTAAYWASLAAGRVAVGIVVARAGPDAVVRAGTLGAVAAAVLYAALPGRAGAAGLALLGFALAPVFPMLMTRTPARLGGEVAAHAIGFQVAAATLGVAAWPSAYGLLADALGARAIPSALVALAGLVAALFALLRAGDRRGGSAAPA